MEKSIDYIVALKDDHMKKKTEYRYSSNVPVVLTDVINPILYKLTQEDCPDTNNLGPMYSPPHPLIHSVVVLFHLSV